MHDLRVALRRLIADPAFTAIAVLSLALGIGANTAIFALVDEMLLRELPVRDPGTLVMLRTVDGARGRLSRAGENNGFIDPSTGRFGSTSFSLLTLERLENDRRGLSSVFGFAPFSQVNVLVDNEPDVDATAQYASGEYFTGLGVPAIAGRTFSSEDDRAAAEPVAVISHRYWQRRFDASQSVVGRTISINRVATTIVGVAPPGFDGAAQAGESPDVTVPLAQYLRFQPNRDARARPSYWWVRIMGRRAPGVSAAQVQAQLEPVFHQAAVEGWQADRPSSALGEAMPDLPTLQAEPGGRGENDVRRQYDRPLRLLLGLGAVVLLAACANVASLLLARTTARRREIALRLSLGASRARIVRQLFVESLLIAGSAAAAGIAFAWAGRGTLIALQPFGRASVALDLPLDARVLAFTIATSAATALLFGLVPALRSSRVDPGLAFQGGTRLVGGGSSQLHGALVVVQVALSIVLLIGAGLFVRTVQNLRHVDAGFDRTSLVQFRIDAASAGYAPTRYDGLQQDLQARLAALPGVRDVTYSSVALLSGVRQNKRIGVPGEPAPAGGLPIVNTNCVAANFFEALRLPVLRGRGFTLADDGRSLPVAVVNQQFVRMYLPQGDPLGRTITVGPGPQDAVQIVGVAADAKYTDLRGAAPATVYLPARQRIDATTTFAVRLREAGGATAVEYSTAFTAIRAVLREFDSTLPVIDLRTFDEQVDRLHAQPRLFARIASGFGVLAVILVVVGLYGLTSHAVARRTGEIGLRMALGAAPAGIFRMILRSALTLVGLGVLAGVAFALAATRLVTSMLFGLSPADAATYGAAALLLALIGSAAALAPARRASRVDPMRALKVE